MSDGSYAHFRPTPRALTASGDHVYRQRPRGRVQGQLPVSSETESSEAEPAVLSYTAFRNRECLLAWRQRYSEREAVNNPDGALTSDRGRTGSTDAALSA